MAPENLLIPNTAIECLHKLRRSCLFRQQRRPRFDTPGRSQIGTRNCLRPDRALWCGRSACRTTSAAARSRSRAAGPCTCATRSSSCAAGTRPSTRTARCAGTCTSSSPSAGTIARPHACPSSGTGARPRAAWRLRITAPNQGQREDHQKNRDSHQTVLLKQRGSKLLALRRIARLMPDGSRIRSRVKTPRIAGDSKRPPVDGSSGVSITPAEPLNDRQSARCRDARTSGAGHEATRRRS
jgi:hypothetical protein